VAAQERGQQEHYPIQAAQEVRALMVLAVAGAVADSLAQQAVKVEMVVMAW
jgi:hypothetical protein